MLKDLLIIALAIIVALGIAAFYLYYILRILFSGPWGH